MPVRLRRAECLLAALLVLLFAVPSLQAAIVHGTVTDPLGLPIIHANVVLVQNGQILALALSQLDGTYQISTSYSGRFYVLTSASNFKQITSQSFYAGAVESHEENVVLERANESQEIVTTATGTPLAQAQVSAAVSAQRNSEFRNRFDLVNPLRQVAGDFVVSEGQYGGPASLYIRGSNPDANQANLDGVPLNDIGGAFDFSNLSNLGIGQFEVYRGPNSVLYGSNASGGVVSLNTPRGSTAFPSFFYEGDAGTFTTFRNLAQLGGTYQKLDYYGGFDAFQSDNSVPLDKFHDDTGAANLGYAYSSATQLRVLARNSDAAAGTPGAFNFYGIADAGKRANQDTYLAASIENRTLGDWHNLLRYDMTRKRQESYTFYPAGIPFLDGNYYGFNREIKGANGDAVSGQAVLNFAGIYPNTLKRVNYRDEVFFQSDYPFTQQILGMFSFRYQDERGAKKSLALGIDQTLQRANYDYTAQLQGNYKYRLYYSLGGGVEKNQLFGTQGTPRIGLVFYPVQPGNGVFHGTKIRFNFAKGYQEPSLDQQFGSLYQFLLNEPGGGAAIQQFHISPAVEEQARTYEGGLAQSFLSERGLLQVSYFHNVYGRQIEAVPAAEVPSLLPQLDLNQRQALAGLLSSAGDLQVNSQAFRAQGIEAEAQYTVFRNLFLRAGYTYLDAVVKRSFTSDAVQPVFNPSFPGVPIGAFTPLRGARPFQRPPHTGYASVNYSGQQYSLVFTAAYASRSDDSTFLGGRDGSAGNSLLLPNRNLDYGYTRLDLGGSYQILSWVAAYTQLDNLTSEKRMAPIGYPSLPFTFRVGLRFALGHTGK